jgi:hypothetical protein
VDPTFGIHPMLFLLKQRIVRCGKPGPLVRTMRASDPKVESTFGIHPMLPFCKQRIVRRGKPGPRTMR